MEAALHDADYAAFLRSEAEREERLEFHDGTIVRRGGNSIAHQRLCTRLTGLLLGHLEGREGQALAAPKLRVEATNRTLAPDLVVVCGPISRSAIDPEALTNPTVVIEVLSPSSESYDLGKFAHYRRLPSVAEHLTLAQDRPSSTVARRVGALWRFEEGDGASIALESLELELDLDALYEDGFGGIAHG
ncbi:MAG TPA: hypothetical protein DEF51_49325 [Myxococcales bacterium]|nr:hypothetical protein [Myxococcales bacterium]